MNIESELTKACDIDSILSDIGFGKFNVIFIIICGLLIACDAIEVLTLAFLGPVLNCQWQITVFEQSFLITSLSIGMLLGGAVLGKFSGWYGRKTLLVLSSLLLAYWSLLSAVTPSIGWLIFYRALMGAVIAVMMSSLSALSSEIMLSHYRSSLLLVILISRPIGSYFVTSICVIVVPTLGWRWFLIVCTLPLIMSLPSIAWLPESPRYLLLHQHKAEALAVLNRIASLNSHSPISDVDNPSQAVGHSFFDLIHRNYRLTSLLLMLIWLAAGFTYYGSVLLITILNTVSYHGLQNMTLFSIPRPKLNDDSCCLQLSWSSYTDTYISITGELFFVPCTYLLINCLGRKPAIGVSCLITALSFICLNFYMNTYFNSFILFLLRGSNSAFFNVVYLYTAEVFPTSVRSMGLGLCNGSSRIGAIIAPFVVNVIMVQYSYLAGMFVFAGCSLVTAVMVSFLPYETRNRPLYQTASDDILPVLAFDKAT